jgi:hypothetical protein
MTLPRLSGFALLMVSASSSFFGFVSVGGGLVFSSLKRYSIS